MVPRADALACIYFLAGTNGDEAQYRGGRKDPSVIKKEEKKKEERKRKGTTLEKHATCFHILFNYSTTTFKVAPSTGRVAASPLRGFEPQDKT